MSRSLAARRLPLAVALALVVFGFIPGPARAHSELTGAEPAPNGSIVEAPERLRLTFSQPIDADAVSIELLDTQQRPVAGVGAPSVSADGLTAEVSLPNLAPGVFTVSYQVVSVTDGHATAGIYAFLIDPTGAAPPPTESAQATSPSVDGLTIAARWLALVALLVALGSMTLWRSAGRRALVQRQLDATYPRGAVAAGALIGAVGLAAYLWLAARPISGSGTGLPLDIAGPYGWTPFAIAMRVTIVVSIIAAIGAVAGARWWLVTVLLGVALAGMSVAGHAASSGGPAFAALDWVHLLGVAAWLGALPAAFVMAWRADPHWPTLRDILRGHGRVALIAAPVVALSGIANSPLVLGSSRELVASDYGNLLLAKAVLLSVAVGIGAVNHLALRGRGRAAVAALVAGELAIAALAVSAAATMVTIQPASARQPELAAPPVRPAHFFGELETVRVHLAVSLPAPGRQAYRLTIRDRTNGSAPLDVQKAFLVFTPPAGSDLPPERVEMTEDPLGGLWIVAGAYTPIVGDWGVDTIVRRQGVRDESLHFSLQVLDPGSAELGPPPDTGLEVPAPLAALWGLLPAGALGWLPALVALAAVAGLWFLPRSRWRTLARWAACGVLVLALAAVGTRTLVEAANAPTAEDLVRRSPAPATDIERGRRIYLANCAGCHGTNGDGDGPVVAVPRPAPLAGAVPAATDAELSYRIGYGVAGTSMPAFAGKLTTDERGDLIGYLRDRFGGP